MLKRLRKRFLRLGLAALVLASVMPAFQQAAYAESTVLTVGQAIANNSGTATVEGFVVAHTTGTNAYDFNAPFANDFNLALADSPTERSAAHLLPVQIPASFRPQFGLLSNPSLIGSKIRVTGTLKAYFSVPGLQSPTAIEKVSSGDPNPPEQVSIAQAKGRLGQTVILQGVVTADNSAVGGGKLSTYVQDATGGINLFDPAPLDLKEGDWVQVTGVIADYRGLAEIMPVPGGVTVLQSGQPLPAPLPATIAALNDPAQAEPLEGRLVKLTGFIQSVPSSPAGGGFNVSLIDADFKGITLRVMEGSMDISQLQPGKWYEITGIASQYNSYQVFPRKAADLVLLEPQPPAPAAAGEYSSIVESVVDGDTIHLKTPVLGTDKVRFVNIDTPETYHTPKNELDQNQLDHGLAAKAYIHTLLKAGDEVTLKVGQEATDDYGRLLAQVIRKSDGLNVNLEMVKQGMAVSYFIWPIGDDYEVYSQAVKQAYDAKIGIWNESNPLLELPFVFRAREQGKGLTRYVGNYFTKKYVSPEQWAAVPVEARVFFASPAEAEANGYLPQGATQENVKVQLLGMNDLHGKIDVTATVNGVKYGRAEYWAAYLRQREAANPNTLIMHSGDMVGGSSPVSALLQDEPTVDILNALGFDVGTLGNHEFDEGVDEMLRLIKGGDHPNGTPNYMGMNFPVIAANVEYKDTGATVLDPYAIKEIGGVKIGFIGVVTTDTPSIVMPSGIANVRFTDEADAVNQYVPELKAQGVEAIVVLAHVPGNQDGTTATGEIADLANRVDDAVDVIYAAHNHVKLNAVVDHKLIVQAWEYGDAIVDVDLEIDPATHDIVKKSAEIVDVAQSGIAPDAEVAAIMKKYEDMVAPKVNAVVGTNEIALIKGYPTKGVLGDNALGNLIADGMRFAMNSDFALMNGGGVRDNLDAGPITWGELFNIQPFANTLVKVDVTGAQFVDILNAMISPQYGPDSFVAGARYTWDTATNKVVSLRLASGQPVDPNATYSLVVNNFMYNQTNAKYKLIAQYGKNVVQGPEDVAATVDFVKSFAAPIHYEAEGRISTDLAAPVTEAAVDGVSGEGEYNAQDVKVTLTATDGTGIGVAASQFRIGGGEWQPAIGGTFTITAEGRNVVEYRSIDQAGNAETAKSLVILIDKTGPSIQNPGERKVYPFEDVSIPLAASDSLSGVDRVTVTLDGAPTANPLRIAPYALAFGSHEVKVTAVDRAGNKSTLAFTVVVAMDVAHLDDLVRAGAEDGKITSNGVMNSLLAKVESESFRALANEVKAQSGKKIDKTFAELLLKAIEQIMKTEKAA
ncbi:endonuclease [Cohnella sp. CFH 77786]|uniref:5'-nucleotidase C-terminal domain-containing protein n=1 Tax=Cohnella sp. CFH 77786 TaxID=2662265 RepID=UPI001C60D8A1|nr:5'-nucleotidase C-terminal domain-containing protein [Cohnella sp. CFH 77786]MBW5446240.1 endonuclease [Cohnella sp. CFH 77786]